MSGKVLFGMKSVRGFPIFLAATAMAMPALPPLLPTNSRAPFLTASWETESYVARRQRNTVCDLHGVTDPPDLEAAPGLKILQLEEDISAEDRGECVALNWVTGSTFIILRKNSPI